MENKLKEELKDEFFHDINIENLHETDRITLTWKVDNFIDNIIKNYILK